MSVLIFLSKFYSLFLFSLLILLFIFEFIFLFYFIAFVPFINEILVNLTAKGISDWSLKYGYLDEKPELVGTVDTGKRKE